MLATAALRCSPRASADGSLKERLSLPVFCAGAGEGVAGGALAVDGAGAGAAGAAGVEAAAGAGVDGAAGFAGAALGCMLLELIGRNLYIPLECIPFVSCRQ